MRRGARWFYLLAGLTLLNLVFLRYGRGETAVVGLGTAQLGAAWLGSQAAVNVVLTVSLALIFLVLGWVASRGHAPAFLTGLIIYGADALCFFVPPLAEQWWLPVAFHVYASYRIFEGYQALGELKRLTGQTGPVAAGAASKG